MSTYITIHRVLSMPVSLPVRGADGLAKRAPYGGVERQRLSSQSIKAHLRSDATGMAKFAASIGENKSVRSALIGEALIVPRLEERGLTSENATAWSRAIMSLFGKDATKTDESKNSANVKTKGKKSKSEDADAEADTDVVPETSDADERGTQILVLGQREIDALVTLGVTMAKAGLPATDLRGLVEVPSKRTAKGKKGQPNEGTPLVQRSVQDALAALAAMSAHSGLDGAMFGRMTTGVALSRVDSAVHVGHALTVHGIQSAVDFWSAQDELRTGDAGAAHINTRELTTGVYYMPIVIDLDQLRKNLATLDENGIRAVVQWLINAISTVTPAAMLGSTAPYPDPGEVMVEVSSRQPVTMMAAFERPVPPTLDAAVAALNAHARRVWAMVGKPTFEFTLSSFIDEGAGTPAVTRFAEAVAKAAVPAASATSNMPAE
jgi:CRISPR system Cascade subunit CasC